MHHQWGRQASQICVGKIKVGVVFPTQADEEELRPPQLTPQIEMSRETERCTARKQPPARVMDSQQVSCNLEAVSILHT